MNIAEKRKNFLSFAVLFSIFYFLFSVPVHAASVSITPAILDYKAKARDMMTETFTITNSADRLVSVYPVVENIESKDGKEFFQGPSEADLSLSLANWISLSRAQIELKPRESREMKFDIQVNLTAHPGIYHAIIAYPEGATRSEAEQKLNDAAPLRINLEVLDDAKEIVQLSRFAPDKRFFWGLPASFLYELKNTGNREEHPRGEIVIYDGKGTEVAALTVNKENYALQPNASKVFSSEWRGMTASIGQYKAFLNLDYGNAGPIRLQDTVFFWVLPWQKAFLVIALVFILCIGGALWLHRYYTMHAARALPLGRRESHDATELLHEGHSPHVVDLRHPEIRK